LGGSVGSSRDNFPSPIRVKIPETVETGIANDSAISAPVIRSRRKAAINAIRSSPVRSTKRSRFARAIPRVVDPMHEPIAY